MGTRCVVLPPLCQKHFVLSGAKGCEKNPRAGGAGLSDSGMDHFGGVDPRHRSIRHVDSGVSGPLRIVTNGGSIRTFVGRLFGTEAWGCTPA